MHGHTCIKFSCSSFYTHIPLNSNSTSSIQLILCLPLSPLPPGLPSTTFCTAPSPPIPTKPPSHSDLRTSITVTIAGDLNSLQVSWCAAVAQLVYRHATGWKVRGSNPGGGGEIFPTRPDRPWDPRSLLNNGYRFSFSGVNRPGRGVDHPPVIWRLG